jgi:hypothetical protein
MGLYSNFIDFEVELYYPTSTLHQVVFLGYFLMSESHIMKLFSHCRIL